jgi:hypothetical protein
MINKNELIYKLETVIEYLKIMVDMIINYIIDYVQVWENQIQILLNMQKMFYI